MCGHLGAFPCRMAMCGAGLDGVVCMFAELHDPDESTGSATASADDGDEEEEQDLVYSVYNLRQTAANAQEFVSPSPIRPHRTIVTDAL